jgi:hypothetical protein
MPLGLGFTRFGPALGSASSGLVLVHITAYQLKGVTHVLGHYYIMCMYIYRSKIHRSKPNFKPFQSYISFKIMHTSHCSATTIGGDALPVDNL